MLNFKEWLLITETKEEKALAAELAGAVLNDLSTVIPQTNKNADKLLLLAAYYYSLTKDKDQIKTDMTAYIGYLNKNKMELINVELASKKPNPPWDDYIHWTEVIHTHQADDADKEKSKFRPSDIDFQNEKPIMTSPDGKIRVYEANNPQQCIILGRGQNFCISQPGNKMWQTYRDRDTSTYYFVYDDTRDDRLGIVVVDVRKYKIVLTDKPNKTGSTLDPYTGELTNDSNSYMKYLREKGIDVSKFVNIPKSPEEQKEHEELGATKKDLNWFKSLSPDYKSKYIGRGHQLTNEQFDYLWQNKFTSLLTQYVKTGLLLNDYQVDKIASNRDLKDNYLHNRIIANQNRKDLTKKEYYLFNPKQKESYYGNMNDDKKLETAIKFNELDIVRYLVEKGVPISDSIFHYALESGNLELVEYLVKNGAKIRDSSVTTAAKSGNLALVKHLIDEKGAKIDNYAVENAAKSGNLDLVKYFLDEKGVEISDQIKSDSIIYGAAESGNLALVKYFVEQKSLKINIYNVIKIPNVNLDILEYLIDEKGEKIYGDVIYHAMSTDSFMLYSYNLELIEYLVKKLKEKGIWSLTKMDKKTISFAVKSGNLTIVKHLVENGAKIDDNTLGTAVISGNLDIVKYLVEKGAKIKDSVIEIAERYNNNAIIDYLKSVMERQ